MINDGGHAHIISQGYPPERMQNAWGARRLQGNAELAWRIDGLPPWLIARPEHGRLQPNWFQQQVLFELHTGLMTSLTPGQLHAVKFNFVKVGDESVRIPMQVELYSHKPPSDFFRVSPRRGSLFMGQVGGPFTTIEPTLELNRELGEVRLWDYVVCAAVALGLSTEWDGAGDAEPVGQRGRQQTLGRQLLRLPSVPQHDGTPTPR